PASGFRRISRKTSRWSTRQRPTQTPFSPLVAGWSGLAASQKTARQAKTQLKRNTMALPLVNASACLKCVPLAVVERWRKSWATLGTRGSRPARPRGHLKPQLRECTRRRAREEEVLAAQAPALALVVDAHRTPPDRPCRPPPPVSWGAGSP